MTIFNEHMNENQLKMWTNFIPQGVVNLWNPQPQRIMDAYMFMNSELLNSRPSQIFRLHGNMEGQKRVKDQNCQWHTMVEEA